MNAKILELIDDNTVGDPEWDCRSREWREKEKARIAKRWEQDLEELINDALDKEYFHEDYEAVA